MAVNYNIKRTLHSTFGIGKTGPTIHQGTTAPNGTGSNGDIYIRNGATVHRIYQKVNGAWKQLKSTRDLVQTKSNNYTTQEPDDVILVDTTGNVVTITLGTTSVDSGKNIKIKDSSGNASINNITINTQGPELIDGASSITLNNDYESVELLSNGIDWFIV